MPRLSLTSTLILTLLANPLLVLAQIKVTPCPTITKTTTRPSCPRPTPSFCAQPECILLSEIDVPCGCPKTVPTATLYTPCTSTCHGACGTAYQTNYLPCSTTSSTLTTITSKPTQPSSCATITQTTGASCPSPPSGCVTPDCIVLSSVTLSCGCKSIVEETSCRTTCQGGCATQYQTEYLPCPYSPTPAATA